MKHTGPAVVSGINLSLETQEPGQRQQYRALAEDIFEVFSLSQLSCFTHQTPVHLQIETESV